MKTEISQRLAALALTLVIDMGLIATIAVLFNGQVGRYASSPQLEQAAPVVSMTGPRLQA